MTKSLFNILLVLSLSFGSPVYARVKYYLYDGDVPFIEMMLNMMAVMGMIDKVPPSYMHNVPMGGYQAYPYVGQPYTSQPYTGYNNANPWLFADVRKNALDGLWVSKNGEMFGIKGQRFLWNDGDQRYLTGNFYIRNGVMVASIKGVKRQVVYRYTLKNNELKMRDKNGVSRVFRRVNFGKAFAR